MSQMKPEYSNNVAKKVAFPNPLKEDIKSQPVDIYIICITEDEKAGSITARSGSFLKALMSACISRRRCSNELNELSCTTTSNSVVVMMVNLCDIICLYLGLKTASLCLLN